MMLQRREPVAVPSLFVGLPGSGSLAVVLRYTHVPSRVKDWPTTSHRALEGEGSVDALGAPAGEVEPSTGWSRWTAPVGPRRDSYARPSRASRDARRSTPSVLFTDAAHARVVACPTPIGKVFPAARCPMLPMPVAWPSGGERFVLCRRTSRQGIPGSVRRPFRFSSDVTASRYTSACP
jgi:hypothetical protein